MVRVGLVIQRLRVQVSGPAGIVGGGSECTALSPPQYHDWGALEQGTEPPTAPRAPQHKWLPTAPGVCSRCVCVHCCVCALGLNAEHEFRVWVTILGRMSRHFHFQLVANFLLASYINYLKKFYIISINYDITHYQSKVFELTKSAFIWSKVQQKQ